MDNFKSYNFRDVMCGQIQCTDSVRQKPDIDYGTEYKKISHPSGAQCR